MDKVYDAAITGSWNAIYLINHCTKCAHMVLDNKKRVLHRECKYTLGTIGEYTNGVTALVWQISPNVRYHYLDKWYGGKSTDEKAIWLQGIIDANCCHVEKLQIKIKEN